MDKNVDIAKYTGALVALVSAFWVMAQGISLTHFQDAQTGVVIVFSGSVIGLGGALFAHFRKLSTKEPVAVGLSLQTTIGSFIGLAVAFAWVNWDDKQIVLVTGFVGLVFSTINLFVVRAKVTAIDDLRIH